MVVTRSYYVVNLYCLSFGEDKKWKATLLQQLSLVAYSSEEDIMDVDWSPELQNKAE